MFKLKNIIKLCWAIIFIVCAYKSEAQIHNSAIDSLQKTYQIPAIGYAVVTSDSVLELKVCGKSNIIINSAVALNSRFHIGSNTKAITSLIASDLVNQGLLKWGTPLFEVFPELIGEDAQKSIKLSALLNFNAALAPFSYNTIIPKSTIIKGNDYEQRYQLAKYLLQQKPVVSDNGLYLTNTGYILAGLMLEKVSGKEYKELVQDLGTKLNINFQFGSPTLRNKKQTYGHNENHKPILQENPKLNWLLTSGNINVSLPEYSHLIQNYLLAFKGKSKLLLKEQAKLLFSDSLHFSFGWFKEVDSTTNNHIFYNFGNANGFMSSVQILKEKGIAFVVFANTSSEKAEEGINKIIEKLRKKYGS